MAVDITLASVARDRTGTEWSAVLCLSLLTFLLIALEFMPASLLTPIARDLAISEGQAGQAITISGVFAILTALFGNRVLAPLDRRTVVALYTGALTLSSLLVALAPNFAVFLAGRALVGVAVGGFWSLSTAILSRLAARDELSKAIAVLQGGTALALVLAAPIATVLGDLLGWRNTFLLTVPLGLAAMLWQFIAVPSLPPLVRSACPSIAALLRRPVFAVGMAAIGFAYMGSQSLAIYLRPFLEAVTQLHAGALSLALLAVGLGGLAGLVLIGRVLAVSLGATLVALPLSLALFAVLLILFGQFTASTATLLVLWGLFATPIAVAWNTWMARVIPDDLETGGGLQVALIQTAIASGALLGGLLFDAAGWWSTFLFAALALLASATLAAFALPRDPSH